jgi:hypothetical protein
MRPFLRGLAERHTSDTLAAPITQPEDPGAEIGALIAAVFEGGGTIRKYDDNDKQRGFWWNKGIIDWDVLAMLETDVPDTPENRAWFEEWAADKLVDRFQQAAIYVKFYGGGASVTTRLITKEDRKRKAGGPPNRRKPSSQKTGSG